MMHDGVHQAVHLRGDRALASHQPLSRAELGGVGEQVRAKPLSRAKPPSRAEHGELCEGDRALQSTAHGGQRLCGLDGEISPATSRSSWQ